jgi:hypothetical protein
MVRLLALALFGLMMFGAAAGGTWWFMNQDAAAEEPTDPVAAAELPPAVVEPAQAEAADQPTTDGLPVAVRARPMSIEELLRYGIGLKEREEMLKQREGGMERQQMQIKLALTDLRGEQQEIDSLRSQIQQQLEAADQILLRIQKAREDIAQQQAQAQEQMKQFESTQIQMDEQERENIKQLSTWLKSMEPEKAAEVVREMSNDGRLEDCVKILAHLEDRDVAKILSALNDAALVDQLISRFQDLKRPEKRSASRR